MIGRNEACWCGSGKKYKKCHMQNDQELSRKTPVRSSKTMIKTADEIEGMRKAGVFNGILMDYIRPFIKAGISTQRIDQLVYQYTIDHGNTPACLGYHGFPKSVCVSINDTVCHGIPSPNLVLKEGDIVNVDLTTIVDGFHADSSETFLIGTVSEEAKRLVLVTAQAMIEAIKAVGPGKPLSIVGETIQPFVEANNYSVVQQYTGHGIGRKFHEFFTVYHHKDKQCESIILQPGMTFTIEPMVNIGNYKVITDKEDKWTVRTKDGSLSAQFEHTLLITETGVEILTRTPSQIENGVVLNLPS